MRSRTSPKSATRSLKSRLGSPNFSPMQQATIRQNSTVAGKIIATAATGRHRMEIRQTQGMTSQARGRRLCLAARAGRGGCHIRRPPYG